MGTLGNLIFWISLLGLLIICLIGFFKNKHIKRFVFFTTILAACAAIYLVVFQTRSDLISKGEPSYELSLIIILYACMLLGMICHYLYNFFLKTKQNRPPFDVGLFLAPIFASPIVFIPLLGAFQNSDINLANLTLPKFMVFFLAFENGFFWKEIFDNRRKEVKDGKSLSTPD